MARAGVNAAADKSFRDAADAMEKVVAEAPEVAEYRLTLSIGYCYYADLLASVKRTAEAVTVSRQAVEHARLLVRDFPADPRHRAIIERSCNYLAESLILHAEFLHKEGKFKEADGACRELVQMLKKLVDDHRDVHSFGVLLRRAEEMRTAFSEAIDDATVE
jgi:hypothetical protein